MTKIHIPSFPDNVPTAPLLRISLSKLLARDEDEEQRLWRAACELGFFYLDLRKSSESNSVQGTVDGDAMLEEVEGLFDLGRGVLGLDEGEKKKFDYAATGSYFGYKPLGAGTVDVSGTRDANEFFNVSKDAILRIPPPSDDGSQSTAPPTLSMIDQHSALLASFMRHAHAVAVDVVLRVLSRGLGLADGALAALHRLEWPSGDQVRLLRAAPTAAGEREERVLADKPPLLGAHTDFGSVTVLFAKVGGLQVLLPSLEGGDGAVAAKSSSVGVNALNGNTNVSNDGTWAYVRPLPGHAVVNLGDALVYFSAGLLRSALHRIVTPPGAQAQSTKYSVVYFCRPEDAVPMRPLKESATTLKRLEAGEWNANGHEEDISAKEWILRRAMRSRGVKSWEKSTK